MHYKNRRAVLNIAHWWTLFVAVANLGPVPRSIFSSPAPSAKARQRLATVLLVVGFLPIVRQQPGKGWTCDATNRLSLRQKPFKILKMTPLFDLTLKKNYTIWGVLVGFSPIVRQQPGKGWTCDATNRLSLGQKPFKILKMTPLFDLTLKKNYTIWGVLVGFSPIVRQQPGKGWTCDATNRLSLGQKPFKILKMTPLFDLTLKKYYTIWGVLVDFPPIVQQQPGKGWTCDAMELARTAVFRLAKSRLEF